MLIEPPSWLNTQPDDIGLLCSMLFAPAGRRKRRLQPSTGGEV
jgi:hypothetical protein